MVQSTQLSGVAAVTVRIAAYDATGRQLDIKPGQTDAFILGTRVLLTCEVTELQGDEVVSYRWYHNRTGSTQGGYNIRDGDPYYRVVNGILLVDVTSWDQGGKYSCNVKFNINPQSSTSVSNINMAG